MGAEVYWPGLYPSVCDLDEKVYSKKNKKKPLKTKPKKLKYFLDQRQWSAFTFLTASSSFCASLTAVAALSAAGASRWGAAWPGELAAVPRTVQSFPVSVGIPAIAQRIQMLKQRVPCNLVIALWAVTEIRASTGNEEPPCLCVTRLGFNVFLFIYLFHRASERKANLVCCIAANFVCIRDALNTLISCVPVGKTDIACRSVGGEGKQ